MTLIETFAGNQAVSPAFTAGGTTAPAQGTTESWTAATTTTLFAAVTGTSQCHVIDPLQPSEIILVTNISGTTWSVTRGAEGTTPVAHAANFTVQQAVTAFAYNTFLQKGKNLSDLDSASVARGNLGLGTAATAAINTTAGTITTSAVGDAAAAGASGQVADAAHIHGREAFGAVTALTAFGAASSNGVATTLARSDHSHGSPYKLNNGFYLSNAISVPSTTATYNVGATDEVLLVTPATGGTTVNLPDATTVPEMCITIKMQGATPANPVNIVPSGTQQIDGVNATYPLTIQRESVTLVNAGVNWWIINYQGGLDAWNKVTTPSGWTDHSSPTGNGLRYRLHNRRQVECFIDLTSPSTAPSGTLFTLPTGYIPAVRQHWVLAGSKVPSSQDPHFDIACTTDTSPGAVSCQALQASTVYMGNIVFSLDS
jgi:hypothetical protein